MAFQNNENKITLANENIAVLLNTPGGLEKLAAEIPEVIRMDRDYIAFGRKVLKADPVTTDRIRENVKGEYLVQYKKDIGSGASFFGEEVEIPTYKIEGEVIEVPILTISSDEMTIDEKRLLVERVDYFERAKTRAAEVIAMLEDYKVLNLTEAIIRGAGTDASPTNVSQIVTTSETTLAKSHLVSLKKTQSLNDFETQAFVINQGTLDDMLAWDDADLDQTSRYELMQSGVKFVMWKTISIITSKLIPATVVYSYAAPEFVGRMPILKDLSSKLTETPNRLIKGVFLYEFIGFVFLNHKAVGKLLLGYTSGDKTQVYAQAKAGVAYTPDAPNPTV